MAQNNTTVRNTDEIRQIQMLALLLSCLPENGKLREMFEQALSLSHEAQLSCMTPANDTSFDGLKTWLEMLWIREDLNPEEQKLVKWQNTPENMQAAIQELQAAEQKIGLRFEIVAHSEVRERELSQVNAQ